MNNDLKEIMKKTHDLFVRHRTVQVGEAAAMMESALLSFIDRTAEGGIPAEKMEKFLSTLLEYMVAINTGYAVVTKERDELRMLLNDRAPSHLH